MEKKFQFKWQNQLKNSMEMKKKENNHLQYSQRKIKKSNTHKENEIA